MFGPARARSSYREFAPVSAVAACTWEGVPGWFRTLRVLPDGCVDLTWDGEAIRVATPHLGPARYPLRAGERNVGVRLRPGTAGAVLGVPVSELAAAGWPVPLEQLWGARARHFTNALRGLDHDLARQLLERQVADARLDPCVLEAATRLAAPDADVARIARAVGLSGRELRRRCHEQVGIGPKSLHRVLRFQRFVRGIGAVATGRVGLCAAAADAGYADQAHLSRECRRLSGSSPRALAERWAAHGEHPG